MAEIKQLQEEGEIPLDQLLASLPPEMLEGNPLPSEDETTGEMEMETEKRCGLLNTKFTKFSRCCHTVVHMNACVVVSLLQ